MGEEGRVPENLVQASSFTGEKGQRSSVPCPKVTRRIRDRAGARTRQGVLSMPLRRYQPGAGRSPPNTSPGAKAESAQHPSAALEVFIAPQDRLSSKCHQWGSA